MLPGADLVTVGFDAAVVGGVLTGVDSVADWVGAIAELVEGLLQPPTIKELINNIAVKTNNLFNIPLH